MEDGELTMTSRSRPFDDRGAVLVHTAFALLALIAFTTFVVDYGTLWLSRRQAQNAADAGALAGALTLMTSEPNIDNTDPDSLTKRTAEQVAESNLVYGQAPDVVRATDVTILCPDCTEQCPNDPASTCVRVDAYRNQARSNPLPVFFGSLVGLTQQGIRATATAEVTGANTVRCLLPFALADRWADDTDNFDDPAFPDDSLPGTDGWTMTDVFEGASTTPSGSDTYVPPYPGNDTTGWTVEADYGRQILLHAYFGQFSAGWGGIVNLPNSSGGADVFDDIVGCNPAGVGIADPNETCTGYSPASTTEAQALAGCVGIQSGWQQGPVEAGIDKGQGQVDSLVEQDDDAHWASSPNAGPENALFPGAVVDVNGALNMESPRIRPVAVFDNTHYTNNPSCTNQAGTACVVKVVNIIGLFIEGVCSEVKAAGGLQPGMDCIYDSGNSTHPDSQVVGRIVTLPASYLETAGNPASESSFLKIVRLIR